MKIAFASDDGSNISRHLGRAAFYVVVELDGDDISSRRLVGKESNECNCGHQDKHEEAHQHAKKHKQIFEPIEDCDLLIAAGMGEGARKHAAELGVKILLTKIRDVDQALAAYKKGTLIQVDNN